MSAARRPMKATAGALPEGPEWVHELKWDGMRAVVTVRDGEVELTSANGKDATAAFPEIAALGPALGCDAVLDGELVAFEDGRPSFGRLQTRMHVRSPRVAAERAATVPVVVVLFDLLELEGRDLTPLPWTDRRRLLTELVEPGPHWQVPATHDDGRALLDAATDQRLEGIVSKRRDSVYRWGARTRDWRKIKVRNRQEFVVGGWAPGVGGRTGTIGGLLVGYHDAPGRGGLRYAGRVGSGLGRAELVELARQLAERASSDCPFDPPPPTAHAAGATWVRPDLVVEVAFAEWTSDRRLRHPSYEGRRPDVDPSDVTVSP